MLETLPLYPPNTYNFPLTILPLVSPRKGILANVKNQDLEKWKSYALNLARNSKNNYEKAAVLNAFNGNPDYAELLFEFASDKNFGLVVNSAAMSALVGLRADEDYSKKLRNDLQEMDSKFAEYFRFAVMSGDPTLIGYGARAFRNEEWGLIKYLHSDDFLFVAQEQLILPMEMETYQELEKTIFQLKGKEYKKPKNPYSHSPRWDEIQEYSKYSEARIITEKGDILIDLDWEFTPLSSWNFIQLGISGFFDSTAFHRVENNFVTQGGCPRGDGWGSPPYNIRSELAPKYYREGSIGMASAGKDTEGSQWFFCHYPATQSGH